MGNVQVAADDYGLLLIQPGEIPPESLVPLHPVADPGQLPLGVGGVAGGKEKRRVFQGNHASLRVQLRHPYAVADGKGRVLCKDGSAGVALFLGVVPVLFVAGKLQRNLSCLELRLLQTEKVGVQGIKGFLPALAHAGAQAVYIP